MEPLRTSLLSVGLLLAASNAVAQSACPGGLVNVTSLGADGTAAADTAAFAAAYVAVTTHGGPCEGDRIFVPAGNWAGHFPTMYDSVYVEGAGATTTSFTGDTTAAPIFWAFAPITFDSFGFWGSPNVNVRLDSGSSTSVLDTLTCRTSSGMFIYDANNQDVHFENLSAIACGNNTSSPAWMGGTVVLNNANNIYMDAPSFLSAPSSPLVSVGTLSVILNGGGLNDNFEAGVSAPLLYATGSTIWASNFFFGGTDSYDLALDARTTFSGYATTFGSGKEGVTAPGSPSIVCNGCVE